MGLFDNRIKLPSSEYVLDKLVQFSAFIFGALSVAAPSGYSYGPALLFLLSLGVIWRKDYWSGMSREVKLLGAIFILYFLVQAVSIWLDGGRLRELDRPSRALMAACMLPLLSRYPARLNSLLFGFATGAILAGIVAVYDRWYLGLERAFGNIMPIQLGDISMTLGLFALCGYFYAKGQGRRILGYFFIFSTLMGMVGSFLSGSRGGWILLPVILCSVIYYFRALLSRRDVGILVFSAVFVVGIVITPQTGVINRIDAVSSDIIKYLDGSDKNTSVGIRFQLWQAAWSMFTEKPFFGWGNHGINHGLSELRDEGKITTFIYDFYTGTHAHNQFLDELSKRGILGLICLLTLCFAPIFILNKDEAVAYYPKALISVSCITLFDYSLTQAFIGHNSGIVFFCVCVSFIISSEGHVC